MLRLEVDRRSLRELDRAIVQYAKERKKDVPDVVNRAAMNVAFRAAQFTPKANRSALLKSIQNPRGLVRWIYENQGPIKGGPPQLKTSADYQSAADRLIAIRMASVAFIKAGWLPAAKRLKQIVRRGKGDIKTRSLRKGREGFGYGTPASSAINAAAFVVNQSVNPKSKSSAAALQKFGGPAAVKAIRYVANDMLKFIGAAFDPGALKFNRKR